MLGQSIAALQPWTENGLPLLCFVLSAVIVVKNYKTATPEVRQRIGFLVMGVMVAFLAYAIYYVPSVPFVVGQIVGLAVALGPITVAYAVFRHRVLDVGFVLNRAAIYGSEFARYSRDRSFARSDQPCSDTRRGVYRKSSSSLILRDIRSVYHG